MSADRRESTLACINRISEMSHEDCRRLLARISGWDRALFLHELDAMDADDADDAEGEVPA